jgi:hypothetical protein
LPIFDFQKNGLLAAIESRLFLTAFWFIGNLARDFSVGAMCRAIGRLCLSGIRFWRPPSEDPGGDKKVEQNS